MRRLIHYGISMAIIPIYGTQVCPFVEEQSLFWVVIPIMTVYALQYLIGIPLWKRVVAERALEKQVQSALILEMVLFITAGVVLTIVNMVAFGFPIESGLKLIVGILGLGFFAAVDLALEAERHVAEKISHSDSEIDPEQNYFPLTAKMTLFASVILCVVVGVFLLLVVKDLDWLVSVGDSITLAEGRTSILKEFLFTLAVILPLTLNIIFSFSQNIRKYFDAQNSLLAQTIRGDYLGSVPVCSGLFSR